MTDKKLKPKLKSCPFCGGEAFICTMIGGDGIDNVKFFVYCEDGCVEMPHYDERQEATACWNTRTKAKGE